MKQHFLIKYILTGVAQLWFFFSIIYCLLLAFFLITGKDCYLINTKEMVLGSANIYKDGYPVPARLSVQIPADTIVKWKKDNSSGELSLSKNQLFRYDKADSILKDTAVKKQFYFSKWVVEPGISNMQHTVTYSADASDEFALFDSITNPAKRNISATIDKNYSTDIMVSLKSKTTFQNIVFAMHSILAALVSLLISFNIVKLLQYVNCGNNFLSPLYKKILNIGKILIIAEVVKLCLGFLMLRWFGLIRLEKVSSISTIGGNEFSVQFNPTFDFNVSIFLFGLSLIILASLFKYGNQLEKEQALTI